jgi:ABC-type Fe3+-citrate transport system substrate-binding protein
MEDGKTIIYDVVYQDRIVGELKKLAPAITLITSQSAYLGLNIEDYKIVLKSNGNVVWSGSVS